MCTDGTVKLNCKQRDIINNLIKTSYCSIYENLTCSQQLLEYIFKKEEEDLIKEYSQILRDFNIFECPFGISLSYKKNEIEMHLQDTINIYHNTCLKLLCNFEKDIILYYKILGKIYKIYIYIYNNYNKVLDFNNKIFLHKQYKILQIIAAIKKNKLFIKELKKKYKLRFYNFKGKKNSIEYNTKVFLSINFVFCNIYLNYISFYKWPKDNTRYCSES